MAELSQKIETSQKTISNWKIRNSINAVKKKCKELGIYGEIFDNFNIDENFLKLLETLYSFAKTNNKIYELKTDLLSLLPKYM